MQKCLQASWGTGLAEAGSDMERDKRRWRWWWWMRESRKKVGGLGTGSRLERGWWWEESELLCALLWTPSVSVLSPGT